jgi:hypothetical protein
MKPDKSRATNPDILFALYRCLRLLDTTKRMYILDV